jgi:hypothetical protein
LPETTFPLHVQQSTCTHGPADKILTRHPARQAKILAHSVHRPVAMERATAVWMESIAIGTLPFNISLNPLFNRFISVFAGVTALTQSIENHPLFSLRSAKPLGIVRTEDCRYGNIFASAQNTRLPLP